MAKLFRSLTGMVRLARLEAHAQVMTLRAMTGLTRAIAMAELCELFAARVPDLTDEEREQVAKLAGLRGQMHAWMADIERTRQERG